MFHLENQGLIRDSHHGFRHGNSCLSNLLVFLDKVSMCIDKGENIDVIYLDFAKAFDNVPLRRLLAKVEGYGIQDNPIQSNEYNGSRPRPLFPSLSKI